MQPIAKNREQQMEIIDAQVHTWMTDRPRRPWAADYRDKLGNKWTYLLHAGQTNTNEMAVLEMAEVGVDAALLSPVGVYGPDNSYEFEAVATFPRKFRVVGWIDWLADDVEDRLAGGVSQGLVGVRIPELRNSERHERGEFDRVLAACEDLGLVISIMVVHPLPEPMIKMLERYQGINFVIGHMGMDFSPPVVGTLPDDPFEKLPDILDLARLDNVHINLTGVPSVSRERFPFRDVWDGIHRIVDGYGADRVMWGSDYTRTAGLHSYWDGTHYLKEVSGLSRDELVKVYGATVRRVFNWPDE
jgi:predicted TIM-barrel fold metal-dependent hydrolase